MKLIDTSVAIDHLRGRVEATRLLEGLVQGGEALAASELVRFELLAGVRPDEMPALEAFFLALTWIPVDEGVVRTGGALAAQFRRSHRGIDAVDFLIAATTLQYEADLLTTNVRHFPMFEELMPPY